MNIDTLENTLKKHSMRITRSRKIIFELLLKSKKSLSAKEVFAKTTENKKFKTDLASVYRNLDLLTEVGLTHKFQDGKYKICDHDESDHHHDHIHVLFSCTICSKAEEVSSHSNALCKLASELKSQTKLLDETHEIVVQGHCKSCS